MEKNQKVSFAWFLKEFFNRTGKSVILFGFVTNILSYTVPIFVMNVYDKVIPNGYDSLLYIFVFVAILLSILYYIFSSYTEFQISNELTFVMFDAEDIITKKIPLLKVNNKNYDKDEFFYLQAKLAVSNVIENMKNINTLALVDIPFSIVCIALIFYIGGSLGYISLLVFLIIAAINFYSQKYIKVFIESSFNYRAKSAQIQSELCQKQHQIKLYNLGNLFFKRHKLYQKPKNAVHYRSLQSRVDNFSTFLSMIASILLIAAGASLIEQGELLVGNLVAISIFSGRLFNTARLSRTLYNIKNLKHCFEKLDKFVDQASEVKRKYPIPQTIESYTCKNIHFFYLKNVPILKGINLELGAYQTFIEAKGSSGKTTLFNILALLYVPIKGKILVNGVSTENYNDEEIREKIHFSCSDPAFFSGTISENIFLENKPESALLDEVLETLNLKPRILKSGITFNQILGGQLKLPFSFSNMQLLKIARALLSNANIYVFDDPFVGLDEETADLTERAISNFCQRHKKGLCIISSRKPKLSYNYTYKLDNGVLV